VPATQRAYKAAGVPSIVVGDQNYGEGSSREHAAMQPRHLGREGRSGEELRTHPRDQPEEAGHAGPHLRQRSDYEKIQEDDRIDFTDLTAFAPGKPLDAGAQPQGRQLRHHQVNHTYNAPQIEWFKAGGALNEIRASQK
jgi:aconitate hydratase